MNSKRMYFVLVGLVGLLAIGLLGGAYAIDSLLQKQSDKLVEQRLTAATLDQQQQQLNKTKSDITKYRPLGQLAKTIVPQDKDQAETVREIVKIANQSGIGIGSITFPTSSLGTTTAGAAATTKLSLSQLVPVPSIPGVYTLAITVQSNTITAVPYNKFINFLATLENNRRTALVSSITLQPDTKNTSNIFFTLTLDEYLKP